MFLLILFLLTMATHCQTLGEQNVQKIYSEQLFHAEDCTFPSFLPTLPRTSNCTGVTHSHALGGHRVLQSVPPMSSSVLGSEILLDRLERHGKHHGMELQSWFSQFHQADRVARNIVLDPKSRERRVTPSVDILLSLTSTVLQDKTPVILHDSEVLTLTVLSNFLLARLSISAVILNVSGSPLLRTNWLDRYNDACFVHIILFSSVSVVKSFARGLPERVWTPNHLLLLNLNTSADASRLLANENFHYSPFLSLLQPDSRSGKSRYRILTYESFRPHNRITSHGVYRFDKPQTFTTVFPDRFQSFHGHNLHLASWVNDFPYLVPGPTVQETNGMCINMLNEISRKLSFNFTLYKEPEDHLWGEMVNDSWVGMIGQIWRRERELCVNVMSMVEDRYRAVDFSVPYFTDSYSFVIRNPLPPPRWWSIVFPFTWETWVAVVTSVVVASLLLTLLVKVSRHLNSGRSASPPDDDRGNFPTLVVVVMMGAAGGCLASVSVATFLEVFQGTWMLMAMIISISYTGNLVAYITVPAKPHRLSSLRELAASSLTPSMVDYGNFVPGALRSSQHPTLSALGKKLELVPNYGYDVGFQQVTDGTHAFLEGTEYFQYMVILYHQSANTYFLPETIYPIYVGWIYPKNTPWKHKFDAYLQAFVESGLCRYWKKVLVADFMREMGETHHQGSQQQPVRPLGLQDLQGAFAVYGLSLLVAVIIALLEHLYVP